MSAVIRYGDDAYDATHDEWVINNRTPTFDRLIAGVGYALYRVIDTSVEYPDFYQIAGVRDVAISDHGNVTDPGILDINKSVGLRVTERADGSLSLQARKLPNEL